jgi:hypothetical protein
MELNENKKTKVNVKMVGKYFIMKGVGFKNRFQHAKYNLLNEICIFAKKKRCHITKSHNKTK